jgi:GNAT superfamily N-acetyltransferase
MPAIQYRPGTIEDSYAVCQVFEESLLDLGQRIGAMAITGGDDPDVMESLWERRRSLFEHLARTAAVFWVAEKDGAVIGYARSIRRGDLFELTEFFVLPGEQSAGVGGELFRRTFPPGEGGPRSIIATTDDRALVRYQKAGVYARFPIKYFYKKEPVMVEFDTDLAFEPLAANRETLEALGAVDDEILGHRRDVDHRWLIADPDREGFLYWRRGEVAGYGYLGNSSGPIALLDKADFPAVLAHAESAASQAGRDFGVEVPMVNRAAIDALLGRGFRMDPFMALFMSDRPFGKFENYIVLSPPFFF